MWCQKIVCLNNTGENLLLWYNVTTKFNNNTIVIDQRGDVTNIVYTLWLKQYDTKINRFFFVQKKLSQATSH